MDKLGTYKQYSQAAKLVNSVAVFQTFASNEQVTQKLSDFNDLANKNTLGAEAVKFQIGSVVKKASEQAKVEKLQIFVELKFPISELSSKQQ